MRLTELRIFKAADILCDPQTCRIGSGGFGDVLVGHNRLLNKAAVKVFSLTGEQAEQVAQQEKIMEEINNLVKASHENIAQVLGWVKWFRAMGIVMQYYKGGNIRRFFMRPLVQIEIALRLRMIAEISTGIAFIHHLPDGKRLIHGDIKPENVLLTEDLHCKIADFGSAWLAAVTGSTTLHSHNQKEIQYTAHYTAPEKLKNLDIKPKKEHDTYSFAILVHMILTGLLPYPPADANALIIAICNGKRPDCKAIDRLKQTLGDNDKAIVQAIEKKMKQCWHHDASQRPDMINVREKFDKLLEKQNPCIILQQVVNAVSKLGSGTSAPSNQDRLVPLHKFSTRTGQFEDSTVDRNVPNAQDELTHLHPPFAHSSLETEFQSSLFVSEITTPNQAGTSSQDIPDSSSQVFRAQRSQSCSQAPRRVAGERHDRFVVEQQSRHGQESEEGQLVASDLNFVKDQGYKEADDVKCKLVALIESQGQVCPQQMVAFADNNRLKGNFLQAILIYKISLDFFEKYPLSDATAEGVMGCVGGLHLTGMGLLEDPDWFEFYKNKRIVRDFVIPQMTDARRRILNLGHVGAESRCLCEAWCLHYIECALHSIGDSAARERTLNLAVVLLRQVFGDDAVKYQVYGHLLNNYGFVCTANSQIADAFTFYSKAVEAYSRAEDLTPEERKERVERSAKNLQEVALQR